MDQAGEKTAMEREYEDRLDALTRENEVLRARIRTLESRLRSEVDFLKEELRAEKDLRILAGESAGMRAVRQAILAVAPTSSTVLIQGETGTGKELVARAIHQLSSRRDRLLVTVNCAALHPSLIASELFGHEKGAFTGAVQRRIGRFELSEGGTLFLDEIAEIPGEIQAMLLRVLQERSIERVGGNQELPVDVRILAATHQNLPRLVAEKKFREDLFFRLNVFPIRVPPLRERGKDILDLVKHFLHRFNRRFGKNVQGISPTSENTVLQYTWPGNVRELENLVERAMILATGSTLSIDPTWFAERELGTKRESRTLVDIERIAILDALDRSGGTIYGKDGAAAVLGMKPTTLYGKMRKHGIRRSRAENHDQMPSSPTK